MNFFRHSVATATLVAAVVGFAPQGAQAQNAAQYPNKIIRGVVPFTPGGSSDVLARLYINGLAKEFNVTAIVENRPGAAGNTGVAYVAHAPADGYTLLFTAGAVVWNPALFKNLGYDPIKDIAPIARLADAQQMLVVRKDRFPTGGLKEYVEYIRKNPGKVNIAASGIGLNENFFVIVNKLDATIVPYSGSIDATNALLSGDIDLRVGSPDNLLPAMQTGTIRTLAVTGGQRLAALPDVPTTTEAGMKEFNETAMYGAFAPGGTPPDIIAKLNAALNKITKDVEHAKRMNDMGWTPLQSTPAEFTAFYKEQIEHFKDVVKLAKIPTQD